ncbi:MAG: phage tail family protein [Lachnospiraceae bacterium]|nr:phage tail family protein [Lachnospiraceae bacterium]
MSADRTVYCKNEDGTEVYFDYDDESPFFLENIEGVMKISNKVSSSENTTTDGETYQGSVTKARNIVITAHISRDHVHNRNLLYKCFKPKAGGQLTYVEEDERRVIDYITEDVEVDPDGVVRFATISLVCHDPFFRDEYDTTVIMSGWHPCFEWQHEFKEEKEPFGERIEEIIKEIENDSAADNIGIEILIEATGAVVNPVLYHTELGEYIRIGTQETPLAIGSGEAVRITTGTNKKKVWLLKDGEETEINQYLDEGSEFIQLVRGKNTIAYDAESGRDYMDVTIAYRSRYLGV